MGGGRCALSHPWILYGSLLTSSQSREGPGADSKHWAGGTFPAPLHTHIPTPPPPKQGSGKGERGAPASHPPGVPV